MKGEIPVCKRCCFFLPLRYGLLAWGYFKTTVDFLIITSLSFSMIRTVINIPGPDDDLQSHIFEDMIIPVIADAVFIADFVATIVFIVGGHKKNVRLMRAFYFISTVMLIFTLVLTTTSVVLSIQNLISRHMYYWQRDLIMYSFYFVVLAVQVYFLLLVRSEIIKLKNIGDFRFVNNAAEAECTMKSEEIRVAEEIRAEEKTRAEVETHREDV